MPPLASVASTQRAAACIPKPSERSFCRAVVFGGVGKGLSCTERDRGWGGDELDSVCVCVCLYSAGGVCVCVRVAARKIVCGGGVAW